MSGLLSRAATNGVIRNVLNQNLVQAPSIYLPSLRFKSNRGNRGDCDGRKKKTPKSNNKTKQVCDQDPKVNWFRVECCKDPCREAYPRFDALYYVPTDNEKRKYTQTWNQCPNMHYAKKKVCCKHDVIEPKWEKRKFPKRDGPACSMHDSELLKCLEGPPKCKIISLLKCRKGRRPPKCNAQRRPSECKKKCCPHPSFSECEPDPSRKRRPIECPCLTFPNMCEVLATAKRIGKI